MNEQERWTQLLRMMEPFHDQAFSTAVRLARSREDGEDLWHAAILRAFEKLPTLRDAERFRSWFFAVLLSVHRSRARRGFWRRFLPLEGELAAGREPAGEDGEAREEERSRAARAQRALAVLPAVQREAIVLFEIEGMSACEVAKLQEVSLSAVKSRLARGRARLRRHYQRMGFGRTERAAASAGEPGREPAAAEGGAP